VSASLDGIRAFVYRVSHIGRRGALERDLDEELRFHEAMLSRDLEHAGASPAASRLTARRRVGSPLALRERSAGVWGFPALEDFWRDARFGIRTLGRSPAFVAIAVVAMAIGIGVNAGFFTLVDALVWQPIPVAHPERMVKLLTVGTRGRNGIRFSYSDVRTIAAHARRLTDLVAYDAETVGIELAPGSPARIASAGVISGNYFTTLGGSAALGRVLTDDDARAGAPAAVVLSDGFWANAFGRNPAIVGGDLIVNGVHVSVAGVARPDFVGINPLVPDFWIALPVAAALGITPGRLDDPANRFIFLHARLAPNATMAQAKAELSGVIVDRERGRDAGADPARIVGADLMPSESFLAPSAQVMEAIAPALLLAGLLLVIACANLGILLLARSIARGREMAIRLAIGASRARVVRQLLTESLLVAIAGSALGLVLADIAVRVLVRVFFAAIPETLGTVALSIRPSWHVVAYAIALAVVSVFAFGLAPALRTTSVTLQAELKGEDTVFGVRVRRSWFRDALVAVQVAGCVALLAAAATVVLGMRDFGTRDTGLAPARVAIAALGLTADGNVPGAVAAARVRFAERVAAMPGVAASARAAEPPFTAWPILHVSGTSRDVRGLFYNVIAPGYFDVVGQRVVSGRDFDASDTAGTARVAVVSASAARLLWPFASPVGQTLRIVSSQDSNDVFVRVVGVASPAHNAMIWDDDSNGYVYLPAGARDFATSAMPLLVRGDGRLPDPSRALRDLATQVAPDLPFEVTPLPAERRLQIFPFSYGAAITAAVGVLGLAMALVGLYGIVGLAVRQRRRDIAVHIAMGAGTRDVLRLVLHRELRLVAAGIAAGIVLALGEARLIANLVLPLPSLGVFGFVALAATLLLVAGVAAFIPARTALRIAPMQVLRQE
jgi:predicted permease